VPSIKLYTVEQAEKCLPLVRRIVADIVATFRKYEQIRQERFVLGENLNAGSEAEEKAFALENKLHSFEAEMLRFQSELQDLSVELKDYRIGLVDFYSRYQDNLVYLCWKLGEGDKLEWWHDLHSGFRGRAAITDENRALFEGAPMATA
jgi:hypothetical protein